MIPSRFSFLCMSVVGAVTAVCLLSGCASSSSVSNSGENAFPPRFEMRIEPFSVQDADGKAFDLPMLGGFNVPRPQFADIDADGDYDLFIQEEPGRIKFLENTGTPGEPRYAWRSNEYQDLDVGEWYRIVDLDKDGDFDILSESRFSYISYHKNEGTATQPRFVTVVDTLRDDTGTPIFADRQNIPHIFDIDCDGLMDLFIGRVDGTITRMESVGLDDNDIPRFRFVTDRWEDIEIIGQNVSLHGANTMAFGDIDNDGDSDLLWGDFFEAGLLLVRNQGTCGAPSLRSEPVNYPLNDPIETSGYNAPVMVDLDRDGDLDIVMGVLGGAFNANGTTRENLYYMEQTGPETFTTHTSRFIYTLDAGSESIVKTADMDGDGDLDLFMANKIEPDDQTTSTMFYFENIGSASAPSFRLKETMDLTETYHQNPAIADLDGDGDLDFLFGKWNREMAYWRNAGSALDFRFEEVDPVYLSLSRGSNTTPALVDIDADGDLDLFSGEASGTLNYYENTGSATDPVFELISDEYGDFDIGRRSFPAFVDLDEDGDYDMVVGTELEGLQLFVNEGTPQVPDFKLWGRLDLDVPTLSSPHFADMDGDGDMDLLIGGAPGGIVYFENMSR